MVFSPFEPVFLFLAVAGLGAVVMVRLRTVGALLVAISVGLLYSLSAPYVGTRLMAMVERSGPATSLAEGVAAGAIVILSADIRRRAPEYGGDTVGPLTLERIRYGARLHRKTGLPLLVSGGRIGAWGVTSADAMRVALNQDFRVPVRWVERRSRNTFENARNSAQILHAQGITAVFLVTHAAHLPRAREAFAFWGITVVPAPTAFTYVEPNPDWHFFTPRVGGLFLSTYALHEILGRLWYRVAYYRGAVPAVTPTVNGSSMKSL